MTTPRNGPNPAPPDSRQNQTLEILLVMAACSIMPFLGLPVLGIHLYPFSWQDLACGLWLCLFLANRLAGWQLLPRQGFLQGLPRAALRGLGWGILVLAGTLGPTFLFRLAGSTGSVPRPAGVAAALPGLAVANLLVWAVFEELTYRYLLLDGLCWLGLGRWPARLLSIVAFAGAHLAGGALQCLQALTGGLILTLARERSDKPVEVCTAHGTYNLLLYFLG